MEIEQKILEIVSEHLSVPKDRISLDDDLFLDLDADSLDVWEIVVTVEDSFGISVADETEVYKVNDLIELVKSQAG